MGELLRIDDLSAGYGDAVVLSSLSMSLAEGEALAVLGRNGMGKTTLMATLMGATQVHSGHIRFGGQEITHMASHKRAAVGLAMWVISWPRHLPFPHGDREHDGRRAAGSMDA